MLESKFFRDSLEKLGTQLEEAQSVDEVTLINAKIKVLTDNEYQQKYAPAVLPKPIKTRAVPKEKAVKKPRASYKRSEVIPSGDEKRIRLNWIVYDEENPDQERTPIEFMHIGRLKSRMNGASNSFAKLHAIVACETALDVVAGQIYGVSSKTMEYAEELD